MQPETPPGAVAAERFRVSRTRFDAGRACLNLLATVARRGSVPVERLPTPADYADWLVQAGLATAPLPVGPPELATLRTLREATYQVLDARRRDRMPPRGAVGTLNTWAAHPTPAPQLDADGTSITHTSTDPAAAALALLARDAIDLATSTDLARVHACEAPECRMLFLDQSRGARRRWCSMAACGNRAKARAHAARTRYPDGTR